MIKIDDAWAERAERIARGWLARHAQGLCDADRDDAVQEALLRMLERPATREVNRALIDALRIASRARDRITVLDDDVPDEEPRLHWFGEEFVERAGLTEKQLRACRLRLDGLTTCEAADVLGITPRAFRMRLRRTRAQVLAARRFLK